MSGVTLNTLIEAALLKRPYHQQRLGDQAWRYSRAITQRFCGNFSDDSHDEVAQQAFVELLSFGHNALSEKSGVALFRRAIFAAIRVIQSDYAPPGQRTRHQAKEVALPKVAAEDVGRIADTAALERATVRTTEVVQIDFDLFESVAASNAVRQFENRFDSEWALRRAPPDVAAALRLICLDGQRVDDAASALGVSRFVLHRRMAAFSKSWQTAA